MGCWSHGAAECTQGWDILSQLYKAPTPTGTGPITMGQPSADPQGLTHAADDLGEVS